MTCSGSCWRASWIDRRQGHSVGGKTRTMRRFGDRGSPRATSTGWTRGVGMHGSAGRTTWERRSAMGRRPFRRFRNGPAGRIGRRSNRRRPSLRESCFNGETGRIPKDAVVSYRGHTQAHRGRRDPSVGVVDSLT
jgi:hypothetical protein